MSDVRLVLANPNATIAITEVCVTLARAAELAEWNRRAGRPLRVPRIALPWPPAAARRALLDAAAEARRSCVTTIPGNRASK